MEYLTLYTIGLMLGFAFLFSFIARVLKQPLIVGYIFGGILLGKYGLNLITQNSFIYSLSELGIAFLLFVVGLQMDLKKLRNIGRYALFVGLFQIIFTFLFSFLVIYFFLNLPLYSAMLISIALSYSSTMVVIKLLSDKKELDSLYGRCIIAILLIQDIFAIFTLSFLSSFSPSFSLILMLKALLFGVTLLLLALFLNKYAFPFLLRYISLSHELLFVFSLSVCFSFAYLSFLAGYSIAIGSFLAGLSLARVPYNAEIASRITSLRDFFLILFFVSLGLEVTLPSSPSLIFSFVILFFLATILKSFFVYIGSLLLKYDNRLSFSVAISLAQVSEFSFIILSFGLLKGLISTDFFSILSFIFLLSFSLTPYLINNRDKIFEKFYFILKYFDFFEVETRIEKVPKKKMRDHIVICGADIMGSHIIHKLSRIKGKRNLLIVDYNPEVVRYYMRNGYYAIYGNVMHIEILERLNLEKAKFIISTIPDEEANYVLIRYCKKINKRLPIFLTANDVKTALRLYKMGADYVIIPKLDSIEKIERFVAESVKLGKKVPEKERKKIIEYLKKREDLYK